MSTNWKDIGMNSGNMRNHRNVTSNKLNYETGKWDSIYEVSGIEMKGYTFDICGQNVVVGIGTEKPFSRLSLGNNDNDGEFNANKPGQLAGIGIHEESNGANFSGLFYNTDISGQKKNVGLIPGLQIMSSATDFSLNDTANTGKIIIGSDNVVTIGGSARIGNESFQGGSNALPGTYSLANNENRKIVLDARGSIRTDGYINFYNQTNNNEFKPNGLDYTTHTDIPVGSLFLSSGGGNIVNEAGLYFKRSNTGQGSDIVRIADATGGGSGGGGSGVESPFDYSLNNVINGAAAPAYIVQKSGDTGFVGGTNITFAGEKWSTTDASGGIGYQNTLTIREGNLSVVTISGENIKVNDPGTSSLKTAYDNRSGGILFASKQILIGKNKDDSAANDLNRSGYALIDAQVIQNVPAFLSYNFATGDTQFNP